MSIFEKYDVGLGHVGSYQAAGRPFLTSSLNVPASGSEPLEISFESVSRTVIVTNTLPGSVANVPLRFGFSANGVKGVENNNYGVLNNGESFEGEFKVTSVFLMSDNTNETSGSVIAGLTGIPANRLATNWTGSVGVG